MKHEFLRKCGESYSHEYNSINPSVTYFAIFVRRRFVSCIDVFLIDLGTYEILYFLQYSNFINWRTTHAMCLTQMSGKYVDMIEVANIMQTRFFAVEVLICIFLHIVFLWP